jgi:hypothetical protein
MGKSYNRNQDKYNKWDCERKQREHKKSKFKNTGNKKQLTPTSEWGNVGAYSDESTY